MLTVFLSLAWFLPSAQQTIYPNNPKNIQAYENQRFKL